VARVARSEAADLDRAGVRIRPQFLIPDEATANIDTETEMEIRTDRAALTSRTALVIAHRLSTIRQASRIVVLHRARSARKAPTRASPTAACTPSCIASNTRQDPQEAVSE
jgi:ABC-type transport system involved in cytochrome bd biosynthesis fused ATPase/permease subunit